MKRKSIAIITIYTLWFMLNSTPGVYDLYRNLGRAVKITWPFLTALNPTFHIRLIDTATVFNETMKHITMPDELVIRDVAKMSPEEIEEECRKLEDAYADALRDNAGFDAFSNVWKRIQELQRQISGRDPE